MAHCEGCGIEMERGFELFCYGCRKHNKSKIRDMNRQGTGEVGRKPIRTNREIGGNPIDDYDDEGKFV